MAEAMTTASRTSGVAPLAVHFDAVDSGSGVVQPDLVGGRREYADIHYKWGFDDPTSGTWDKTNGLSCNVAYGYVAAHVFETPGVYTVTLRTTELDGTITDYEQEITVTDPDTVFSGNTYYVDTTTGNDDDDGLSEENAYATFAKAMAEADTGCRILFKRGETFPASATGAVTGAGPGSIGAYGTGADPVISFTSSVDGISFTDGASDWRVADLALTGNGGTADDDGIENAHDTILLLNLAISGFRRGVNHGQPTYDNLPDQIFVVDCDLSDNGDGGGGTYGMYHGGTNFAILGTLCDAVFGEHHIRTYHLQKSIISSCELTNVNDGKHALKLHNEVTITSLPDSKYIIVSDNYCTEGVWTIAIGPQSSYDETVSDCVIERNLVVSKAAATTEGIVAMGPYMTIRNNVVVNSGYPWDDFIGVQIKQRSPGPLPDGCRTVNNTCYGNAVAGHRCVNVVIGSDILAYNNLAVNKNGSNADALNIAGGSVTHDNNLDDYDYTYLTDPDNGDYTLVAGGAAINTGTTLAYNRIDRAFTARPQGAGYDVGAYEFVSGGDVTPPTITDISHADASYITASSINLDITFSEPITTPLSSSIALTGAAAASAIVGTPSDQGGNKWRWPISSLTDGALNVEVGPAPDTIQDLSENDLVAVDYDYTVDLTPPTVVSVDPLDTATVTSASITVDVNFSEAVTGVDTTDLVLTGAAAGVATVDSVENTEGNIYRFTISGLVNGALNLSLAPDAEDIQDVAGNDLAEETWSYTVSIVSDTTPPTVISKSPAASSTITSSSQTITVTFSEVVQDVDATDMVLSGSARGIATGVGTPQQGATAAVWLFPITNLVSGTLNITLAPDAGDITDLADNDLAPVAWSYTVDLEAAEEATGFLTAILVNLKESLAQSDAFQNWVGASGPTTARTRIHRWGLTKTQIVSSSRPYALVSLGDTRLARSAGGARSYYSVSGRPGILFFNDVDTDNTEEEQLDAFTETFESILLDLAENTGANGYYDFAEAEIDPPRLGADNEHPDEPLCIQASVWFPYSGGVMQ